ncbi:hypothetical protein F5887DRAFT_273336 [Amanita rubescens]|nr:hypothetical protein F5887DRAFT_273336 [Amanita rubescens]
MPRAQTCLQRRLAMSTCSAVRRDDVVDLKKTHEGGFISVSRQLAELVDDCFPGRRKPVLFKRPGKGGWEAGHPAIGPDTNCLCRSQLGVDRGPYESARLIWSSSVAHCCRSRLPAREEGRSPVRRRTTSRTWTAISTFASCRHSSPGTRPPAISASAIHISSRAISSSRGRPTPTCTSACSTGNTRRSPVSPSRTPPEL